MSDFEIADSQSLRIWSGGERCRFALEPLGQTKLVTRIFLVRACATRNRDARQKAPQMDLSHTARLSPSATPIDHANLPHYDIEEVWSVADVAAS
jgi:hypothetical protein